MKNRILKNWTFTRGAFLIIGIFLLSQAIIDGMWFGIFIGGYFAVMGVLGIGCAGKQCAIPQSDQVASVSLDEIEENGST